MEKSKLLSKIKVLIISWFILISGGTLTMVKRGLSLVNIDIIADWLHTIIDDDNNKNVDVIKSISEALTSAFVPINEAKINDEEIDELIEAELIGLKRDYDLGDINMNKNEFQEAYIEIQNQDREMIRKELIEADSEGNITDAIAACEYLTALLRKPTTDFKELIGTYGKKITNKFDKIQQETDVKDLQLLVPKAIEVINKIKKEIDLEAFGLLSSEDQRDFLDSLNHINENLQEISSDLRSNL